MGGRGVPTGASVVPRADDRRPPARAGRRRPRPMLRPVPSHQRRPLVRELARRFPDVEASAEELIAAGAVTVDGVPRTNPRMLVDTGSSVRIDGEPRALRGEAKLRAALDGFGVDPAGAIALDAGAAAGGFVRALLDAGARRVYAV